MNPDDARVRLIICGGLAKNLRELVDDNIVCGLPIYFLLVWAVCFASNKRRGYLKNQPYMEWGTHSDERRAYSA